MSAFWAVPAGVAPSLCRGCSAPIYWVKTPAGKNMPIDCDAGAETFRPTDSHAGKGLPHWGTCPAAKQFVRKCRETN